jgi:hypothetical protein
VSKHTPGPWYVDDLGANIRCNPDDDDFGTIVATMESSRSPDETKANARLIASAPDLLAALDLLVERAEIGLSQAADHDGLLNCDAIAKARVAIVQAGGER